MLRLKRAFFECQMSQQELVSATGWGAGLVSRVFDSGDLSAGPVNTDRFIAEVTAFVETVPIISQWLSEKELPLSALFDNIDNCGEHCTNPHSSPQSVDLDSAIVAIAGRAAIYGASQEETACLSKTALYLLAVLRDQPMSMDAMGEIEVTAGSLLLGAARDTDPSFMSLIIADWEKAPQRRRGTIVQEWAALLGVSKQTVYKILPKTRVRKNRGHKIPGIEEAAHNHWTS